MIRCASLSNTLIALDICEHQPAESINKRGYCRPEELNVSDCGSLTGSLHLSKLRNITDLNVGELASLMEARCLVRVSLLTPLLPAAGRCPFPQKGVHAWQARSCLSCQMDIGRHAEGQARVRWPSVKRLLVTAPKL